MSLQVIDEDQYTPAVVYGAGSYTCTREQIGTRSISVGIRTLVDPADPDDIKQVHALQDAIKVEQKDPLADSKLELPGAPLSPRAEILNGTWTFPEAQPVP
jgi:hypothetical protein